MDIAKRLGMKPDFNLQKRMRSILFLPLLLPLFSCSSTCPKWTSEETVTTCMSYNSGKIFLKPTCRQGNIELELARGTYGLRLYVNLFSLKAPPEDLDPCKTKVIFDVGEESFTLFGEIFDGGQRILLPPHGTQWVINMLSANQEFTVHVGRYYATIVPTGFSEAYCKLMEIPIP